MKMTVAYEAYRRLEAELIAVRAKNEGLDASQPEEDVLLEDMDTQWWKMTVGERAALDAEASKSLIR